MVRRFLLLIAGCLFALSAVALADTIDPGIGVVGEDPPTCGTASGDVTCLPISTDLVDVHPTLTESSPTFYFYNDTGAIINSITFNVQINTGLTPGNLGPAPTINFGTIPFSCNQGSSNSLAEFRNCEVAYNTTSGILSFMFSGVYPKDGDELCPAEDCEVGEEEGIPPVSTIPYAEFAISLTGWVPNLTDDPIYSGVPTFTNSFTTPEPSTLWVLGLGLALLVGMVELRRRKSLASLNS